MLLGANQERSRDRDLVNWQRPVGREIFHDNGI